MSHPDNCWLVTFENNHVSDAVTIRYGTDDGHNHEPMTGLIQAATWASQRTPSGNEFRFDSTSNYWIKLFAQWTYIVVQAENIERAVYLAEHYASRPQPPSPEQCSVCRFYPTYHRHRADGALYLGHEYTIECQGVRRLPFLCACSACRARRLKEGSPA